MQKLQIGIFLLRKELYYNYYYGNAVFFVDQEIINNLVALFCGSIGKSFEFAYSCFVVSKIIFVS